ncbi:MAG: DUF2203 domain-containing protein [Candidatus Promineifilaceae bacterium]|jgi:hypothetical protein
MSAKYFTVDEANALLPSLKPLMGELLERRARSVQLGREVSEELRQAHIDLGGPIFSELTMEFATIERLLNQIKATGCVVKSLEGGLLDFLATIDGRDVYLCWRYGEPSISFYHELHTGFRGRQPLA